MPNSLNSYNLYLLLILLLLFFSSCSFHIDGAGNVAADEFEKISDNSIENYLLKNTTLEEQNIIVLTSVVDAIENLKNLKEELEKLNRSIDNISKDYEYLQNTTNLDSETLSFLYDMELLIYKSNMFVSSLHDSIIVWERYLFNMKNNTDNLSFDTPVNKTVFVNSITEPLESFN